MMRSAARRAEPTGPDDKLGDTRQLHFVGMMGFARLNSPAEGEEVSRAVFSKMRELRYGQ